MANQNPIHISTCIDMCTDGLVGPRRVTKGNFIYPLKEIFFLVVAIDGKTIKGSGDPDKPNSAIHVVSAFASEQGLCLGQRVVDKKHNEI